MFRIRNFLPLVALLVGAALLGLPASARATFEVQVYDDGVLQAGITTLVAGDSLIFSGTTTHFSISAGSGSSDNPGSGSSSLLSLSNNETITTTFGSGGGTNTIKIVLSQTGWTSPTGTPLLLSSSGGGSIGYAAGKAKGASDSVSSTYQGFLDNTNTLFGQPVAGSTPQQAASASLSSAGTAPLVYSPSAPTNLVPGGTPFSMTDILTFTFTVGKGSGADTANASFTTTADATAVVPAPSGVVLALTALPLLGIGVWLRRRRLAV